MPKTSFRKNSDSLSAPLRRQPRLRVGIAEPDAEIERELREDVATAKLWIYTSELQITVENGEVALRGKVESKADAELLEYFATRVPGVVAVHSTLRWRMDARQPPSTDPHVHAPPPRTR